MKLIRKNPPNGVILAMKSTEKQTLSFQETTRPQPNSNHRPFDQEAQALTTKPRCLPKKRVPIKLGLVFLWTSLLILLYICVGYTLTIGFTSGRVDCLHWEFIEPLCSSLFSMPRPLLTLWPHEDGITTSHMTWSTVQVMSVINEDGITTSHMIWSTVQVMSVINEDGIAISHMTWSTVQVMSVINEDGIAISHMTWAL